MVAPPSQRSDADATHQPLDPAPAAPMTFGAQKPRAYWATVATIVARFDAPDLGHELN